MGSGTVAAFSLLFQVAARTSAGFGPQSQSFTLDIDGSKCYVLIQCTFFIQADPSPTPVLCEAQNVGLVRYPTTLAPATVTTECADNASPTTSLSVTCTSTGSWSGSPQCQCNSGYQAVNVNGRQICHG